MKKIISLFLVLITLSAGFVFADDSETDPFDTLATKLMKDFKDDSATVAVKIFKADLSGNEKKKISKSVQYALYCDDKVEIVSDIEDADYVVSGTIETDGPNYIVSAKLTDNYDGTVVGKARQKVPKNYYGDSSTTNTQTVIVEKDNDVDAGDVLGAVVAGAVIGGVIHAVTTPPRPAPAPAPRPRRDPHRP